MKLKDVIYFSGRNMIQKKTQSLLTIIGIVIGIMAIVSLISLGYGVQSYIQDSITSVGANIVSVYSKGLGATGTVVEFDKNDVRVVEKVRGVESVMYGSLKGANVEFKKGEEQFLTVNGVDPSQYTRIYSEALKYNLESGRWLKDGDKSVCIIGNGVAHDTYERDVKVGDKLIISDKKYKVVGILEEVGDPGEAKTLVIPRESSELFDSDKYQYIIAYVKDVDEVERIAEDMREDLEDERNEDDFQVYTAQNIAEQVSNIFGVFTMFLVGVASISLIVGAVGISNTMHMSILERRKDIGILKAIGAENSTILKIFVVEAGFLGLVGGIAGTILGIIIAKVAEYIASGAGYGYIKAWITPELILSVLAFSFIVGVLSGYFPSRSGAKLDPIQTLRGD
ncbi:putative ABC transport system permease protein [Methanococcus voltae]|uniref:ABC transporter permease n=1 Tax=Methanococcus voltae TaxID=2188 RepID=UPI001AEB49DF|nr:ABC transporter permease [Methanococcus voltae]MBP2144164.1 putative ABC transport system permease protein [Methanococcus voltae]